MKSKPKSKAVKSKPKARKEPKYIDLEHFPLHPPEESSASVGKRRQTRKPLKQRKEEEDDAKVVYVKLDELALAKKAPARPLVHSEPVIGTRGNDYDNWTCVS